MGEMREVEHGKMANCIELTSISSQGRSPSSEPRDSSRTEGGSKPPPKATAFLSETGGCTRRLVQVQFHLPQHSLTTRWEAGMIAWQSAATADDCNFPDLPMLPSACTPSGRAEVRLQDVARFVQLASGFELVTYRPAKSSSCTGPPRGDPNTWVTSRIRFEFEDARLLPPWLSAFELFKQHALGRPQRLLVLVNPVSGMGKAKKVWGKVEHLFGDISVHRVETTHRGHAGELLKAPGVEERFDGVVCVGGDGLLMEAVNGWMENPARQGAEKAGKRLRFAPLPAGSTDCTACSLHGTRDADTAALHVVLGDCLPIDLAKCTALPSRETRYAINACMYGFFADTLRGAETTQVCCSGKARYDTAGVGALAMRKRRLIGLKYRSPWPELHGEAEGCCCCGLPKRRKGFYDDPAICRAGDRLMDEAGLALKERERRLEHGEQEAAMPLSAPQVREVKALSVVITVLSCRGPDTPEGVSPDLGLCDGMLRLQWTLGRSRIGFLRYLLALAQPGKDQGLLSGTSQVNVTSVELDLDKSGDTDRRFNVDGELWPSDHDSNKVEVLALKGAVDFFCRGPIL
eukprot:Hpha_TRINITY_DN10763_c0_g1::TRINITY_DN10763_c0_g1_i1::g.43566::m.43566/K04715/E2.7.1.138, CERK; ceramide kinase